MEVREYREKSQDYGGMRFPMVVSAAFQLGAVLVVMSCYERLLACHPLRGAILIRYILPTIWMIAQFVRWVLYLLGSSTFESEWRFVFDRSDSGMTTVHDFVTKTQINMYKVLLYTNMGMVVLLGSYDTYLLLLSDQLPDGLFCESDHWQTHWTFVLGIMVLALSHLLEARCYTHDLDYERRLITKYFNSALSLACVKTLPEV